MLFLFPVKDGKLSTGVNAYININIIFNRAKTNRSTNNTCDTDICHAGQPYNN